ncbi:MAG: hypothetical protein ABW019_08100 [Chitinophagaceae bacterium]
MNTLKEKDRLYQVINPAVAAPHSLPYGTARRMRAIERGDIYEPAGM